MFLRSARGDTQILVEENSCLADFSHLAVGVQVFPLSLDRLLHPAHQTTAFRPLDPVPGLEAENVANCRKSVLVFISFLVILTRKNLLAMLCANIAHFLISERFWVESRVPIFSP